MKSVSPAKLAANRANAQKSTGPRTLTGKAIAAQNAITHGLLSRRLLVAGERAEDFDQYRAAVVEACQPADLFEAQLVARIVELGWRLRRVPLIETDALAGENRQNSPAAVASAFRVLAVREDLFTNLTRYERHLERSLREVFQWLHEHQVGRSLGARSVSTRPIIDAQSVDSSISTSTGVTDDSQTDDTTPAPGGTELIPTVGAAESRRNQESQEQQEEAPRTPAGED